MLKLILPHTMKRIVSLCSIIVLCAFATMGQKLQDVIYMKNDNILRGEIIERQLNGIVKIRTTDRNILVLNESEIERISKEELVSQSINSYKKFIGIAEFGVMPGLGSNKLDMEKLSIIGSFQLSPCFSLGAGSGLRDVFSYDMLMPFFVDLRTYLPREKLVPYLALGAGYAFNINQDFNPEGYFINPEFGLMLKVRNRFSIHLGLGYNAQWLDNHYKWRWDEESLEVEKITDPIHGISIVAGITF